MLEEDLVGGTEGNEGQYIECAERLKLMYNNSEESERSGLKSLLEKE